MNRYLNKLNNLITIQRVIYFLFLLLMTACNTSNSADLEKLLSPAALPYLKAGKLIQVSSYCLNGRNTDQITIAAGKTTTILDAQGPGIITRVWFAIESKDPDFLRRIVFKVYWDNEDDPSINTPLGDFFGCGFKYKPYSTSYLSMTSGGYTCFFPMPFEGNARMEILNETGEDITGFTYQIDYEKLEGYLSTNVGYLHAYWHREIRTDYDSNYIILKTEGIGHVVGVNLNIQSYDGSFAYLEGVERIFIDGEKIPSIQGTGTEDYFSGGDYFNKGEFTGPYNGLILKDDSLGRIAAYRFHIPDPIPFRKSINFSIGHGRGNNEVADYSSTVYWYQTEPHKKKGQIMKPGLRIPLRIVTPPNLLEAEKLQFNIGPITSSIMDMSDYGPEWSENKQRMIETRDKDEFSLTLQNLQDISYNIDIYYTKGPNYGNVGIYVGDNKVGEINGYNPIIYPGGKISVKNIPNPYSRITLDFKIEGKDEKSSGYYTGLDGFDLQPKRIWVPDWYFIGPFPYPVKNEKPASGLDSIYLPEKKIDLKQLSTGTKNETIKWEYLKTPGNGYVSLSYLVNSNDPVICYAVSYIYSAGDRLIPLYIGSTNAMKVFCNRKQILRYQKQHGNHPDQEEVFLHVNKGWNELLLKLENNASGLGYFVRLIDKDNILTINADKTIHP
ncbi:MAG: DUF2961 domain-containing protein [Bacteroidetes bacterium]|nr:DUF2961 domain-containing protein [Bacteroidota bacterium]